MKHTMQKILHAISNNILLHYEIQGFPPHLKQIKHITDQLLNNTYDKRLNNIKQESGLILMEDPGTYCRHPSIQRTYTPLTVYTYDKLLFIDYLRSKGLLSYVNPKLSDKELKVYADKIQAIRITSKKYCPVYFKYI